MVGLGEKGGLAEGKGIAAEYFLGFEEDAGAACSLSGAQLGGKPERF